MSTVVRRLITIAGILVGAFVVLAVVVAIVFPEESDPPSDRASSSSSTSRSTTDSDTRASTVSSASGSTTSRPSSGSTSASRTSQPAPLATPDDLVIVATSESFTVRWGAVERAASYNFKLSDSSASCTLRGVVNPGLECTKLSPETVYSISVQARSSTGAVSAWATEQVTTLPLPIPELPPYVAIRVNERYDDIRISAVKDAVAEVVAWYEREYGLRAEFPSVIQFEPQCTPTRYDDVLGYATPGKGPEGEDVIDVCVRLDEDNDGVLETEEFRWLIAHEYFHVLQANANWAFEDYELTFGSQGQCGRQLVEGAAEYFGQFYAWGELQDAGIFDDFFALFGDIDWERQYYYDEGAKAFAALIRWKGSDKAVRFWESDESRCSDAFLSAFDVTPAKYEADWRELIQR